MVKCGVEGTGKFTFLNTHVLYGLKLDNWKEGK